MGVISVDNVSTPGSVIPKPVCEAPWRSKTPLSERLAAFSVEAENGCREWTAASTSHGYGVIIVNGQRIGAHRVACELANGAPPPDKTWALHTCHNPKCIRGSHLYWGDAKDNARDMVDAGRHVAGRAGTPVCVNGHEYTPENTYWEPRGWGRACKECRRERTREWRARRRAELAKTRPHT